jgi:hypothetical protein
MVALRRLGAAEDCARVGEFLATDLSTTSGTVTPTDGGLVHGKPRRTVNTWREVIDILAGGLGIEPRLAELECTPSSISTWNTSILALALSWSNPLYSNS